MTVVLELVVADATLGTDRLGPSGARAGNSPRQLQLIFLSVVVVVVVAQALEQPPPPRDQPGRIYFCCC